MRLTVIMILVGLLTSGGLRAQQQVYKDTLEVEIGENTKVVFLAESLEDFELIDRYDLNFLFDELWRMRKEGLVGEEQLSRRNAEQLRMGNPKPEEVEPQMASLRLGSLFLTPTFGLSAASSFAFNSGKLLLQADGAEVLQYNIRGEVRSQVATELAVGNTLLLHQKDRKKLRLRLAAGITLTEFRLRNVRRERFVVVPVEGGLSSEEIDDITTNLVEITHDRVIDLGLVFLEVGTIYEWRNRHPQGRWQIGAGLKAGLLMGDGRTGLPGSSIPIYEWGDSQILISQERFQYALAGQLGYSFANIYLNYYPRAYTLSATVTDPELVISPPLSRPRNQSMWVIGTRLGF